MLTKNNLQQRLNVIATKETTPKMFVLSFYSSSEHSIGRKGKELIKKIVIPTNSSTRIGAGHTCFVKKIKSSITVMNLHVGEANRSRN